MMHTLTTSMRLPRARDQVFAFFAEASNLQRITPPELGFAMVTPQPIHLNEGACIEYRLHLFGIPFSWQSEISAGTLLRSLWMSNGGVRISTGCTPIASGRS